MLIDAREGSDVVLPVYIVSATEKKDKTGRAYLTGELKDKSLTVRYNLWDSDNVSCPLPKAETYAKVKGRVESFNGKKQITILTLTTLAPDAVNPNDFKKTSSQDIEEMWKTFTRLVNSLEQPVVKTIANHFLQDQTFVKALKYAPAGRQVHNAWIGGLLEHLLVVGTFCDACVQYYNAHGYANKLQRDIALFGALFHDIGKVWEYDYTSPEIKVTTVGELQGHIHIGSRTIADVAEKYYPNPTEDEQRVIQQLIHIVLSHHGTLENGSPVNPKTPEAIVVHYLDNMDTKMMNAFENIAACSTEFTDRIYVQENVRLFNTFKKG